MARLPDPELETKILDAAHRLWSRGGEKALTMRAVARAAGTNTPAVYRRFRDRNDILRGLLRRIRFDIAADLEKAASPEKACEKYLDFALRRPWDYELFYQYDYELHHLHRARTRQAEERPAREVMKRKLLERLGGSSANHERLLLALWMLGHGAAMLLIDKSITPREAPAARKVFTAAVTALLRDTGLVDPP